ncbi:MAG: YicC family protein [Nitrospirae bacterium]|nr:YicC family protein [Nitrospirota bacterium]
MIRSMTGYGAAEREGFKVEVRTLNHRYLDVNVRIPSFLMEHEMPVRNFIKDRFARGKVDITISLTGKRQVKVRANKELAKDIYDTVLDLQKTLSIPGSLDIGFLSWYKEFLLTEEPSYSADDLYEALSDAVARVEEMRTKEGEAIKKELESHAVRAESLRAEVEELSLGMAMAHKEALSKRLSELISGVQIDESRLAQEVAMLAQKSDITEELARLRSHFQQFNAFLDSGKAIGRKMDFLMQEMYRETNTIASKVDDIRIINLAIEIKTGIEKLKEQVQNIE